MLLAHTSGNNKRVFLAYIYLIGNILFRMKLSPFLKRCYLLIHKPTLQVFQIFVDINYGRVIGLTYTTETSG